MAKPKNTTLAEVSIEKTFKVKLNGKEMTLGVRYNSWGNACVQDMAPNNAGPMELMRRMANTQLGERDLLALLYGGLEGYRFEHNDRPIPWTIHEAARVMDAIGEQAKMSRFVAVSLIVGPPYTASLPKASDIGLVVDGEGDDEPDPLAGKTGQPV